MAGSFPFGFPYCGKYVFCPRYCTFFINSLIVINLSRTVRIKESETEIMCVVFIIKPPRPKPPFQNWKRKLKATMNWIAHFREYLIKVVYIIASLLKFVYMVMPRQREWRGGGGGGRGRYKMIKHSN